jgi:O-antigen/teichoic acid export membrane protein
LNPLKKLAGQTAIYGLSSIIGRVLNYFLTPLYTYLFATSAYGVVTDMYAYVAFLVVLLTFGMETTFFRFASKSPEGEQQKIYNTALLPVMGISVLFILVCTFFSESLATSLQYPDHSEYVVWLAIVVGLDAITAIPMAKLRQENNAKRFVYVNLASIFINIGLNLFFIAYCKPLYDSGNSNFLVDAFYSPDIGIGYIFIANLIASIIKPILLFREISGIRLNIDKVLFRKMIRYAYPLIFVGLAGIINETFDRILLKLILIEEHGREYALGQVGIYGACYKVSILITLFIQAFRYAAEPFFFSEASTKDEKTAKRTYAKVMKYFVIITGVIYLGIMMYIDIVMYFVGKDFRVGAEVVPILLLANIFLGIYYNQSVWYKLTDKTMFGAYISIGGAVITIALNLILIPYMGFVGSAWATLVCYASMMVASYYFGQQHYKIKYPLRKIYLYVGMPVLLYLLSAWIGFESLFLKYTFNTILFGLFLLIVYWLERPVKKVVT